jgi:hypothetical protein
MSDAPFIPPRTQSEIASPAPPGQRHDQMLKVAIPLLAGGLTPEAIFTQLRGMYAADVRDREIWDVVAWAASKNPQPCGYHKGVRAFGAPNFHPEPKPERVTAEQAIANAEKWLAGFRCDESDLWHASPWYPPEDWRTDALMLFAALYDKDDFVNVVTDFTTEQQKNGQQKTNPKGAGTTLLRDDWIRWIRKGGVPQSKAGAWVRPNPVKQHGTGANGAPCDSDVTSFRFCLLESDDLPLDLQLSFWARLPLPIAAIITTGGRSVHAWVKLNCENVGEYQKLVARIYELLARFGLCLSNKTHHAFRVCRTRSVK